MEACVVRAGQVGRWGDCLRGGVAQRLEQRLHKPRVAGGVSRASRCTNPPGVSAPSFPSGNSLQAKADAQCFACGQVVDGASCATMEATPPPSRSATLSRAWFWTTIADFLRMESET